MTILSKFIGEKCDQSVPQLAEFSNFDSPFSCFTTIKESRLLKIIQKNSPSVCDQITKNVEEEIIEFVPGQLWQRNSEKSESLESIKFFLDQQKIHDFVPGKPWKVILSFNLKKNQIY